MHDVIIIGAGPAGQSAALWCDELGLDTLLLEAADEIGGQLSWIYNRIENHLGVQTPDGGRMREIFAEQIAHGDFDLWTNVEIEAVDLRAKRIRLRSGEQLEAISIIIATGVRRRKLNIPGEAELAGRGVIYSATRDRALVAGKDVCVVGGGDAAAENALLLSEVCPTVTLVHRGSNLSARKNFVDRIRGEHRITVFTESTLERIIGTNAVEAVVISRRGAIKPFEMAAGGVLIRIGVTPNTELFADQLEFDERGYIKVSSEAETSISNVFAAGDVSNPRAPTVSGAVGAGATAAKVIAWRLNSRG